LRLEFETCQFGNTLNILQGKGHGVRLMNRQNNRQKMERVL
jgi:hypothetical protein